MVSEGLGVCVAVRMNAGCSGECGTAVDRSDTHLYCYAEWKHQAFNCRVVGKWVARWLSGQVVATLYWSRNPSRAHLSHSLQESSPYLWTVFVIFALFVFCWIYDLKVPLLNVTAYQQWYPQKTCTCRRFYCTQCEEGLPQWQRRNTEIRTCI